MYHFIVTRKGKIYMPFKINKLKKDSPLSPSSLGKLDRKKYKDPLRRTHLVLKAPQMVINYNSQ